MAQYIFAGSPAGGVTLYVDNFYFSAAGANDDEIVVNGDFSDGLNSWTTYLADWDGVSGNFDASSGEAAITGLAGPTTQPWYVQLNQVFTQEQIDALQVGETYTISLDVRSNVDGRPAKLFFGEEGGGFATIASQDFTADITPKTITQTFELGATYPAMKLGIEAGLSNDDLYVDNVSLMLGGTVEEPEAPTAGAPAPTEDAADVLSLFSDSYTDVAVNTWRTDWSVANYEEVVIDGNAAKKYTNLDFVGIETTGENLVDASGMDFVHVDLWTPNAESVRLKLVDWGADQGFGGGDDTEHEVTFTDLTPSEWNSLKIPLADFVGLTNRSAMAQYIFAGSPAGGVALYVDNFYFSSSDDAPVNTLALPVTFEDSEQEYGLTDFGGNASEIVVDPTDAGNMVAQSTKTAGSQTWAGTTVGGAQGFAEAIPFTADATTMSLKVWSPQAGIPVRLKVEDASDPTISVETEATVTTAEAWITLVFDFSSEATGTAPLNLDNSYNKASVFFNFGTSGADETYYWDDMSFGGEPPAPVTNSYSAGWNMVSLPTEYAHSNYSELFPTALDGTMFGFSGTYTETSVMQNGEGYWLNFSTDSDVSFPGSPVASNTVELEEGWNMIGSAYASAQLSDPDNITLSGTLYSFDGNYSVATSVEPGEGYWIATSAAGSISIETTEPATVSSHAGSGQAAYDNIHSTGELNSFHHISVNNGEMEQALYFGGELQGNYHPLQLALPPAPPSGAFDVRFADNSWVSTASSVSASLNGNTGGLTIEMSGSDVIEIVFYRGTDELDRMTIEEGDAVDVPAAADRFTAGVAAEAGTEIPSAATLDQNYPNPFNPTTSIRFGLPASSEVVLDVYNMLGQRIARLVDGEVNAGYHTITFDASNLSSGVYLYRIQAGSFTEVKRFTLLK